MPKVANPGRGSSLRRLGVSSALALSLALAAPAADSAEKRQQALQYYQRAVSERLDIETLPESDRSPAAYQKVIDVFKRVYLTTPHSSKADDSLFAIGEIYVLMSDRFGPQLYRELAAEAYRFLIREYPHSPLSAQAKKKIEEMDASAASAPVMSSAAAPATPPLVKAAAPAEPIPEDSPASKPAAKAGLPRVIAVRYWSSPGVTRVIVELEADAKVRSDRLSNPDRVYLDLANTRISPELKNKNIEVGDALVKQVRMAPYQLGVTRVVVDLKASVDYAISTLTNPPRVAVELRLKKGAAPPAAIAATKPMEVPAPEPATAAPLPQPPAVTPPPAIAEAAKVPPPKAAQPTSRGERNLIRALGLKIERVVIDPGHGGYDTGTIGPTGLLEKDLTLDVANRLGNLISERIGSEIVFTRSDDTFIALEDRTALANEKGADLFISVHANSSSLRGVRGIETYYLNLTGERSALEVAARENAASNRSIHELQDLVSKITLTEKISESREFAMQVQKCLFTAAARENPTLRNRGVRKAPFVVLIGARMPSVLAEISFLSNPRDERLLKTGAYRQKLAEALYNGVAAYARSLSRVEVASAK